MLKVHQYTISFPCRAVEILRSCAATDTISLLIARDEIAQTEYQRLSIPNKAQPGIINIMKEAYLIVI